MYSAKKLDPVTNLEKMETIKTLQYTISNLNKILVSL